MFIAVFFFKYLIELRLDLKIKNWYDFLLQIINANNKSFYMLKKVLEFFVLNFTSYVHSVSF